jgi:hypothetical protein
MAIWYIFWLSGKFFPLLGKLYQEKSGNPELEEERFWTLPLSIQFDFFLKLWGSGLPDGIFSSQKS